MNTKAAYNFWNNIRAVSPEKQLAYHFKHSISAQLEKYFDRSQVLLQLCDFTELDYTGKRSAAKLGPLSYSKQRGIQACNSLLVNSLGVPLGLLDQSFVVRDDETFGKTKRRYNKPIEEKETYEWIRHFETGQDLVHANPGLQVIYVADRGADMLQLYERNKATGMDFIVRSKHDRLLVGKTQYLSQLINATKPTPQLIHTKVVDGQSKKERAVTLELRFGEVDLVTHKKPTGSTHNIKQHVYWVDVRQVNSLLPGREAIHWRLFTSCPVHHFEQAVEIVRFYLLRWIIERFHFTLKSAGAKVEELQLTSYQRLKNAITTYSIAAMEVMSIKYKAEKTPDLDIYECGITTEQHQVLYSYLERQMPKRYQYDPQKIPTIKEFCVALGILGGFLQSKRRPLPGLIILTRAREKLDFLILGFNISKN